MTVPSRYLAKVPHAALLALMAFTAPIMASSQASAQDAVRREAQIVVSATGEAQLAPDLAILTLGVTRSAKTARAALDDSNAAMAAVLASLKQAGIAERDLQTSGFSIAPQYSYPENDDGTSRQPVLIGYEVANTLTVRVRALASLGAVIDKTVSLGVNQGGDIRFSNDKPDAAIQTARAAAVKSALAKARTLAEAAGVRLGRVIEMSENADRSEPMPLMRMSMAKEASDTAVPVAAGENSYAVTVNVTFAIDQ